ncbi:MAG TPA: FAD-dependent oxidoreductase [Gaiellaceae bacterium]|nr:FAD-dependent oxidoreductase [Gaiellaceae bacterium]
MAQSGRSAAEEAVIVGAGVIGLACAYALCRDGVRPLVIDAAEPGAGASWGNGGLIAFAPQIVGPVPGPDVLRQSVLWLLQPRSPLRLVPRPAFEYARWIGAFISSCSAEAATFGLRATLAFNAKTAELFDDLVRDGLEFEMDTAGVVVVYQNRRAFNAARKRLTEGSGGVALSANEALDAEPLLRDDACAGAIRYDGERQVRPDALTRALVDRLTQMGIEIRSGCRCTGLLRSGTRVTALETPTGTIRANAFILAAGSEPSRV